MTSAILIAGLLTGLAGSLHCVGMCGPLSLALPLQHLPPFQKFVSLLLYQSGRITTYSFIGLLFGLIGRRIYITGYQHWFSIGAGIFILVTAIFYFAGKRSLHFKPFNKFYLFIQQQIAKFLTSKLNYTGFYLTGIANGFLPCGMVYIALAGTLSLEKVSESVFFMSLFGLGTLPAMMMIAYAGQIFKVQWRNYFKQATPYLMAALGVLLILRGLNLGISFISPELPVYAGKAISCHH